ncbi:MAG: hypothetical protein ACYDAG_02870 [Chloroflexota bacterium]
MTKLPRGDTVSESFGRVPDEAYLGFGMASLFTAMALYMVGRKDEGLFVGVLGSSFAMLTMMVKLIGEERSRA